MLLWPTLAMAEPVPEYAMRAAFLYNFAAFTEWPSVSNKLNLCILGPEASSPALDNLEGKEIRNGVRIAVNHIASPADATQCQVLYFESPSPLVGKALTQLGAQPVLTIYGSDENDVGNAMIRLKMEKQRLTFEINLDAAQRAGLKFSSRLLRLAQKVY
jgi:hypothetical protein